MWKLLLAQSDWESYKKETEAQAAGGTVQFRKTPKEYPCLADAYIVKADNTLLMCFVYAGDAVALIQARSLPENMATAAKAEAAPAVGPSQADFNKHTAAYLATVAWFLVETGIAKERAFEDKLNSFLSRVDQWSAEDQEKASATVRNAFNRLHPTRTSPAGDGAS